MADKDEQVETETETTEPIADEHGDVRRQCARSTAPQTGGDASALAADWQPVATLLEDHASADAEVADTDLPMESNGETPGLPSGA